MNGTLARSRLQADRAARRERAESPRIGLVGLPPLLAQGLTAALGDAAAAEAGWQVEVMPGFDAADAYVLHPHDDAEAAALRRALPPGSGVLWIGRSAPPAQAEAGATDALQAMAAGARAEAALDDDATPQQLRAAVAAVLAGLSVRMASQPFRRQPALETDRGRAAPDAERAPPPSGPAGGAWVETTEPLTSREIEVYELLAKGLSNREIAGVLGISAHTAKFHVAQILAKVGAATRAEAVALGLRLGLIGL